MTVSLCYICFLLKRELDHWTGSIVRIRKDREGGVVKGKRKTKMESREENELESGNTGRKGKRKNSWFYCEEERINRPKRNWNQCKVFGTGPLEDSLEHCYMMECVDHTRKHDWSELIRQAGIKGRQSHSRNQNGQWLNKVTSYMKNSSLNPKL